MEDVEIRLGAEQHIEVHRYAPLSIAITVAAALALQAFLPVHFVWTRMLELPLLVTIYFALSRRNASIGLLLGMTIGLLQDSLSGTPIGLYGIAKTVVGYVASSIGARIDVEHSISRFLLTVVFFHLHHAVFALTRRLLLGQHEAYMTVPLLIASLVNGVVALGLFPLLDRLRKS
ncbi:MAG: rod shape-determining protein MreD [Candidatus Acidiferrales bacterium]